jgi:hypothetical protein
MNKRTLVVGLVGMAIAICRLSLASAAEGFVYTANEKGVKSAVDFSNSKKANQKPKADPFSDPFFLEWIHV